MQILRFVSGLLSFMKIFKAKEDAILTVAQWVALFAHIWELFATVKKSVISGIYNLIAYIYSHVIYTVLFTATLEFKVWEHLWKCFFFAYF